MCGRSCCLLTRSLLCDCSADQVLRSDAEAAKAAGLAADLEREAAEQGIAADENEIRRLKQEQIRLLEQAALVSDRLARLQLMLSLRVLFITGA
jgi:hypothetical protein